MILIVTFVLKQTQREWSYVFIICAVVYLIGTLVFCIFCQSTLQNWAVVNAHKLEPVESKSSVFEYQEATSELDLVALENPSAKISS